MNPDLVEYVAKALAAYANRGYEDDPECCCSWSSKLGEAKVALQARKEFKRLKNCRGR